MATQDDTKQTDTAPTETIVVSRSVLEKLEQRIEELELAAMVSAETPALPPPTPIGPRWAFLHDSAPAFSVPLPADLKHKTQDGRIRFKPDYVSQNGKRSRYRPRRGKYSTSDPEIGNWLTAQVAAGHFKGVVVDTTETRMKLQQDEIAYLSA